MHHKRKRPKNRRAGCDCGGKLYKRNGNREDQAVKVEAAKVTSSPAPPQPPPPEAVP